MLKKLDKALSIAIIGALYFIPGLILLGGSIWVMLTHGGSPVGVVLSVGILMTFIHMGIDEIRDELKD